MQALRLLIMDVDGTLTDGKVYLGENGNEMKAFNVKDGLGIVKASGQGVIPVIITGRNSKIVARRAAELGIKELYQGVTNKCERIVALMEKYHCTPQNAAFIGDDENDLPAMCMCGKTACPQDAAESVKAKVDYVCINRGGEGAVREFIDHLLTT